MNKINFRNDLEDLKKYFITKYCFIFLKNGTKLDETDLNYQRCD